MELRFNITDMGWTSSFLVVSAWGSMDAETPLVVRPVGGVSLGSMDAETPLVVRPAKKGPIAPEAPPRRRGVWKASLVAVAVVFGVAAVGWSRQGGDVFEFQLVGFDDDFDTGLPGGAWGEKLYECKNGEPTVPKEYKKGDWGSIAGDWYVIAGNVPRSDNAVGRGPEQEKSDSTSLQREGSAQDCSRERIRFESAPRDNSSSKNQPERVEHHRDRSL